MNEKLNAYTQNMNDLKVDTIACLTEFSLANSSVEWLYKMTPPYKALNIFVGL